MDVNTAFILKECGFNNATHVKVAVIRNADFVKEELATLLKRRIRQAFVDPDIDLELMIGTLPHDKQIYARQYADHILHKYYPELG